MPLFHYKAKNSQGEPIEGTFEAVDKYALYHQIKKDGNTIISAEEAKSESSFSLNGILSMFGGGISMHDKIIFARNLSQMIEAGLPLTRGLSIMERQAKKDSKLKKTLVGLNESLSKGKPFSEALRDYPDTFSTLFVSMVKAGEESGNSAMALKSVAAQMEKSYQLNKKIKGALMYPAVILCLMIIIGVLMMVYMVPTLTATFVGLGIKLPLSTRLIIYTSNFLKSYFVLVIFAVLALVAFLVAFLRTARGQPVIGGIVKQVNSARTARTLSSLLSSGVDIVVAIGVTKDVMQNSYYKVVLEEIQTVIQKGELVSTVFLAHEDLYPLFVGEMVSVGEESGKIGEMLLGVATFYEEEVDQATKDMSSIIEPVLMIFIGAAVGFFAISMLAPTYSLADAL